MPQINQLVQPLTYTGSTLGLDNAAFMPNVRVIFRPGVNGRSYISYIPGKKFNGFSLLEAGMGYVIHSLTTGYTIPENSSAVPVFTVEGLGLTNDKDLTLPS